MEKKKIETDELAPLDKKVRIEEPQLAEGEGTLVDASRGAARNIQERGAAEETEDGDGGWGDLARRVRRRVDEKSDDAGDQPSAAAAYNYGEMEVSNIKKEKWADMEDEEDDTDWIDEMLSKDWKQRMAEGEAEDERERGVL